MVLFAAVFGAIVGSFLNALSFRFHTGRSMGGRSRCMHCRHTLGVVDLIPVFSFIWLRGRCRYCGVRLSMQYVLVECAGALLAGLLFVRVGDPLWLVFWFVVWMTLLFVVVYDARHHIIPLLCSALLVGFALVFGVWVGDLSMFISGVVLMAPLFMLSLVSRGAWMGWSDSALEFSLGTFLGFEAGFTALMLAFWVGGLVGIALLALPRGVTIKSEVPFAPFLVLGAAVAFFFDVNLFTIL